MTADYGLPALRAISDFLPTFSAADFRFAHNDSPLRQTGEKSFEIVGYRYDPQVHAFWRAAEQHGWLYTFDWGTWGRTPEASQLRFDTAVLAQASALQLSRLLSMFARMERFGDGAWLSLWDSGLLLRILTRAHALANELEGAST
ncbi:hypothetical protein GCM10010840_33860 [Deinococcus aerolatus]|uniref:Uncharacterized protein n=1 Tax=Deinococcus aerolatus TaxID=522487 RepID=A0ABQ2GEU7_9DEIO|nr:DUF6508 domain-containing protein [Deinococcus aerolatus]GGL93001.1 hypothetical protein GCM10010840_33860 [Deinococcus aerolatus]